MTNKTPSQPYLAHRNNNKITNQSDVYCHYLHLDRGSSSASFDLATFRISPCACEAVNRSSSSFIQQQQKKITNSYIHHQNIVTMINKWCRAVVTIICSKSLFGSLVSSMRKTPNAHGYTAPFHRYTSILFVLSVIVSDNNVTYSDSHTQDRDTEIEIEKETTFHRFVVICLKIQTW